MHSHKWEKQFKNKNLPPSALSVIFFLVRNANCFQCIFLIAAKCQSLCALTIYRLPTKPKKRGDKKSYIFIFLAQILVRLSVNYVRKISFTCFSIEIVQLFSVKIISLSVKWCTHNRSRRRKYDAVLHEVMHKAFSHLCIARSQWNFFGFNRVLRKSGKMGVNTLEWITQLGQLDKMLQANKIRMKCQQIEKLTRNAAWVECENNFIIICEIAEHHRLCVAQSGYCWCGLQCRCAAEVSRQKYMSSVVKQRQPAPMAVPCSPTLFTHSHACDCLRCAHRHSHLITVCPT